MEHSTVRAAGALRLSPGTTSAAISCPASLAATTTVRGAVR